MGHIGKDVIGLLQPFGCKILVNDIIDQTAYYDGKRRGGDSVSKDDIYTSADIVSIHIPLDKSTRAMMNAGVFEAMKDDAYFINVARGGIVDQDALKAALKDNQIAGAAIDVYETEPSDDTAFLNLTKSATYARRTQAGRRPSLSKVLYPAMGRSSIKPIS